MITAGRAGLPGRYCLEELLAELVEVRPPAEEYDAVARRRISSPVGGNTSWPSARLMATTITPVRRLMSASRRLCPARACVGRIGNLVHLDGQARSAA